MCLVLNKFLKTSNQLVDVNVVFLERVQVSNIFDKPPSKKYFQRYRVSILSGRLRII